MNKDYRLIIERIYKDKNPDKIDSVEQLLSKYKGNEVTLLKGICKKYNVNENDYSFIKREIEPILPSQETEVAKKKSSKKGLIIIAAVCSILLIGGLYWFFIHTPKLSTQEMVKEPMLTEDR